ncbi:MAG TPA: ABC transporter permease [Ktedonobacterales bacterium]|nr:ABC transporter permease [Ktedonobacterales bacterium]
MFVDLRAALWAEMLKARRARMPAVTLAGFSLAPLMGALFMKILLDPAWAARFGALTTKAQFSAARGDWPTYFGLLTQALAVGGFIIFSLVVIWLFGREYSDRTAKDLLALPTSRATIVTAKLCLIVIWCALLTLWIYLLGLALGRLIGLPGWTTDGWLHATAVYATTASLTIALTLPLAWAASAGRGYLPAIGVTILLVFLAQVLSALGLGPWFPWAAPALLSGAAGPEAQNLGAGTYLSVVAVVAGAIMGVIVWWRAADQI